MLDTFPVGGGRSSFEIFAVGTPIVMLYNRTSILQVLTYRQAENSKKRRAYSTDLAWLIGRAPRLSWTPQEERQTEGEGETVDYVMSRILQHARSTRFAVATPGLPCSFYSTEW